MGHYSPWGSCKGSALLLEKASIHLRSRGVFFEGEDAGGFAAWFSCRVRIKGVLKLFGGKHSSLRINNGEKHKALHSGGSVGTWMELHFVNGRKVRDGKMK